MGNINMKSLYNATEEHDACGVGFVADLENKPSHNIIQYALTAMAHLTHRGGREEDEKMSDGSGILFPISKEFFGKIFPQIMENSHAFGLGFFFLPYNNFLQESLMEIIEKVAEKFSFKVMACRDVPTDINVLSRKVLSSLPEFRQILFISDKYNSSYDIESELCILRKQIEFEAIRFLEKNKKELSLFHIASLSSRSIIYKGILPGKNLSNFYLDLAQSDFTVSFAIFHERFSTNTKPSWHLTQPFRNVAHNGEINTIKCNKIQMNIREHALKSEVLGDNLKYLLPSIHPANSDSGSFDNALELLCMGGYSMEQAILTMIPEPILEANAENERRNSFYDYSQRLMEPWDGPTTMVFTDGKYKLGANLDRNGLRPCRYSLINNNIIILSSESGVLDVTQDDYVEHGQLAPGKLFLVDLEQGKIIQDADIKNKIFNAHDYKSILNKTKYVLPSRSEVYGMEREEISADWQNLFGFDYVTNKPLLKQIMGAMIDLQEEPVGAMGLDEPLAVLSHKPQSLFNYFKQLFAQVTNPSIDPIREKRTMSLSMTLGGKANLFQEPSENKPYLHLENPFLFGADLKNIKENKVLHTERIFITLPITADYKEFSIFLEDIFEKVRQAVKNGKTIIILSDKNLEKDKMPIPALLAVAAVHQELINSGLRHLCDIIIESGQIYEVMQMALLLSFGANAIYPFGAYAYISKYLEQTKQNTYTYDEAIKRYSLALEKGLLKVLGRLGISAISSFAGAQCFEAIGIHEDVTNKYFTSIYSRVGGIKLEDIFAENKERFTLYQQEGKVKNEASKHLWNKDLISLLQKALKENDYSVYRSYTSELWKQNHGVTLRSVWNFQPTTSLELTQVEKMENIRARFVGAPMSLGALSKESHECIAKAFNNLNLRSNSGEGGEEVERTRSKGSENDLCSRVRQLASGRFGVTAEYLVGGDEVQIKIAQGAKPGEGGQLPAHKVSPYIAKVRHTPAHIPLISPPPHHDVYSIEDLSQLIYDIKKLRAGLKVSVKLVAEAGIGTVAVGVVKAGADTICISGHDGGTGAAPLSSIYHVGLPWELGVAEVHQALLTNAMRYKVTLQADGQIFSGRDIVTAFMLGADEIVLGTSLLLAMGCIFCRQCYRDRCPMGICTQEEGLRKKFIGNTSEIENLLTFLAEDCRNYLAKLGFQSVDEIIGRADLFSLNKDNLPQKALGLDFSALFHSLPYSSKKNRKINLAEVKEWEEKALLSAAKGIEKNTAIRIYHAVQNTDRAIGTNIAGLMALSEQDFNNDFISLYCTGTAGQSFGAFAPKGLSLYLAGSANDYVGKGLCGGKLCIAPYSAWATQLQKQSIIGNVALYGATSGKAFICGRAGERFAVRNSGAIAVVEGLGEHGCEYMTDGTVIVLGECGENFAAGMTGGLVYVYDPHKQFEKVCNKSSVELKPFCQEKDFMVKKLLQEHVDYTQSVHAKEILADYENKSTHFIKIIPKT